MLPIISCSEKLILTILEQFMEFDEDNSGDIGKNI